MADFLPALSNGGNNIAVIYSNDWLAHIVANPAEAITQPNLSNPNTGLGFFDVEGYRLVPTFDLDWKMIGLRRDTAAPDPRMVIGRLANWLGKVESYCESVTVTQIQEDFPEQVIRDLTLEVICATLKQMHDSLLHNPPVRSNLTIAQVFDNVQAFLDGGSGSGGSPWHQALHAIGWANT
jgi:hypothetical protein